ncbi:MAG: RDD family protein [Rudaea sp.]|nr:RDD family protein [Rudaea sp.]
MNDSPPDTATPAPLHLRLCAGLYDLLPLLGVWFVAGLLALLVTGGALDPHRGGHKLVVQSLVSGLTAGYFVLSWARGGQTIGMRAWRLRVVGADGSRLPAARALLRFLVALLSLAALGAGFWWALIDAQKRTWHDMAAHSMMVRLEKR